MGALLLAPMYFGVFQMKFGAIQMQFGKNQVRLEKCLAAVRDSWKRIIFSYHFSVAKVGLKPGL